MTRPPSSRLAGVDIGGTKCAVTLGKSHKDGIRILDKRTFATTASDPAGMLSVLGDALESLLGGEPPAAIGISCGGPLDPLSGVVLSPPNLPGWDCVPAADYFSTRFSAPALLQNDANACAMAEWRYGAGLGTRSMIFLTFGTGLGAGLILDGRLYAGPDGMAGEIGHIRIADDGPTGFQKTGSLEGFCSGGGIAGLGRRLVRDRMSDGSVPRLLAVCGAPENITAKAVGDLADAGDALCREVYRISGEKLGQGLSLLVDLLNPEAIVIGSIFTRSRHLLWDACDAVMRRECLSVSYSRCRVLSSKLGESVGDIAALAVAADAVEKRSCS